jgi:predicted secreted protein
MTGIRLWRKVSVKLSVLGRGARTRSGLRGRACQIALLGAALLGTPALAANRPEVTRVAFSPDGARVLVLTRQILDGSGFPEARLVVLDTATGRTLRDRTLSDETPGVTPAALEAQVLRGEQARLKGWNLWPGRTSVPRYRAPTSPFPTWGEGIGAGQSRSVPVALWSRPVPLVLGVRASGVACDFPDLLPGGAVPATFTLRVGGQRVAGPVRLPTCAARFRLDRVDIQGDRALLTVRAYRPGFEGPDSLPVFVAARLR